MQKHILKLPDGTEISSGASVLNAIQSVTTTHCVNSGTELTPGSTCAAMLEAKLITPGGSLDLIAGTEVVLYRENEVGSREQVGIFTLEKPTRPTANTMKLTGFDRVAKLDKDLTSWLAALDGWPYTLLSFAKLVCQACGLTLTTNGIPNGKRAVYKFSKPKVTGRQLMQWVGELACRFCRATPGGDIELAWYTSSGVTICHTGDIYYFANSLSYENYQVAPIDAVQIRHSDSAEGFLWPTVEDGSNVYVLAGNPLLSIFPRPQELLGTMQLALSSIASYTPCKVTIPASVPVQVGQAVNIVDKNGVKLKAYVMIRTQTGQKATLECTGSPRRDSSTAQHSTTAKDQAAEAELVAQVAANALTQQQIFDKLTNNGQNQGLYLEDGRLYINGTFFKAGRLDAKDIVLSGAFKVYSEGACGGSLGYMSGSDGSIETPGIGVSNASGDSYVVATDAGVRMQSGSTKVYIIKNGRLVCAGNMVCAGTLTVQDIAPATGGLFTWKYIEAIGETVLVKL